MRTRAELIAGVLETLGIVGSGQTPEAEDFDTINRRLDGVLGELGAREVYSAGDTEEFEDEIFPALADVVAANVAAPFVVTQIQGEAVRDFRLNAERRLLRMQHAGDRGLPVKAEYF